MPAFYELLYERAFIKTEETEQGKRKKIDYKKLLGGRDPGKNLSSLHSRLSDYISAGRKEGFPPDREDAEFTLMTTYSLINLIIKKATKQKTIRKTN